MHIVPSSPTEASLSPKLFQATPHTESVCVESVATHSPVCTDHILTFLSADADAMYFPFGEMRTARTHAV